MNSIRRHRVCRFVEWNTLNWCCFLFVYLCSRIVSRYDTQSIRNWPFYHEIVQLLQTRILYDWGIISIQHQVGTCLRVYLTYRTIQINLPKSRFICHAVRDCFCIKSWNGRLYSEINLWPFFFYIYKILVLGTFCWTIIYFALVYIMDRCSNNL